MSRRKPPPRVQPERSRNNPKRRLCAQIPSQEMRQKLAALASYGCYAKHKFHPTAYGLKPYAGTDEERTFCDEHAQFRPDDLVRVPALLRRAIMAGLWADYDADHPPRMLWSVDDNGWIYELRITNAVQCEYHGYPVLASDAFARVVAEAFSMWVMSLTNDTLPIDPTAAAAAAAMQERYR